MNESLFVGRKYELGLLNGLLSKKVASLAVIKGRRRIGKSRLVEEFAKGKKFYVFSGLPPVENGTAQSQRNEFARQLSQQTGLPEVMADDWSKLFALLAEKVKTGRAIVLLDEISWMGSKDPDFLGKFKNCWDIYFKKNPKLIILLCGSISSWIEKNIISSSGFFGRIALKLTLEELQLPDCNALLEQVGFRRSPFEKFMLLGVTGAIPWYIELIQPTQSAMENMKRLCFEKDGILVDEYRSVFHDLFGRRGEVCRKIVEYLAQGPAEYLEIATALNYSNSGSLSEYLDDLLVSGFINRDFTWALKTGKDTRLSKFRLSDNYLRFYLKYIGPRLNKIKKNQFLDSSMISFSNWDGVMGLQFENLVLNNRKWVQKALGIKPEEVISDNPYFQNQTTKHKACQIDYLIQTRYQILFACEIKCSRNSIGVAVVKEIKEKLSRLVIPRGFSCLPVLIHTNGVSEELEELNYFSSIIDFEQLLIG